MNQVNSILQTDMLAVNTYIERLLCCEDAQMQQTLDWILMSRGKQLRPKMLLLCSRFGKSNQEAVKIAAMLEVIHMATLVHDDIIDDSDVRRGKLSVQKKFGKHMAVYTGDFMIFKVISEAVNGVNHKKYIGLYDVFQKICYGELGQNSVLYNINISVDEYIKNITGKTAAMFQVACELGATVAGCCTKTKNALAEYGKNFGILFQIRDDLLDYTSDEKVLGKPIFQDFSNGIYTLPLIYSFQNSNDKEALKSIVQKVKHGGITTDIEVELFKIISQSEGFEKTRDKADEYYKKARDSLDVLANCEEKKLLKSILDNINESI